ncbi:P-loop containing nucleoside triphosphate hydrolase protein, partial [Pelagophyceae sp. CCMP2097]
EAPSTRWADVGGQRAAKLALRQAVEWPVQRAAAFANFRLRPARGVLLHGPPGCAKTLLARAAAKEARCAFIALSGADVYSPYVGEAEASVRRAFAAAAAAAPAILFFDEVDALVCDRGAGGGGDRVEARVLATFLTCMDGVGGGNAGVLVVAATNRPHAIDRALLRPGRLEAQVHVALPGNEDRLDVLRVHTRACALAADVDFADVARRTRGRSGAELRQVVSDAGYAALRR